MEKREQWRQYGFVIQQLTSRELKRKYARAALGVLWSVLNPLLSMGNFTFKRRGRLSARVVMAVLVVAVKACHSRYPVR